MRLLDHQKRGIKPVRYARVVALAAAIGLHLGIFLLWLPEQPAPGRQYNGSRARLNLRLYPLVEDQPAPQVPPRTTASTGQVAQTRPGQPRSTIDNPSASEAAPSNSEITVSMMATSPRRKISTMRVKNGVLSSAPDDGFASLLMVGSLQR